MSTQYRIPELGSFNWQQNVVNQVTAPTESETKGIRYIIKFPASGVFIGLGGKIATANKLNPTLLTDWIIDTPTEGWILWDNTANKYYYYTGAAWAEATGITNGHTQNTDTGTTSATFQLDSGNTGPKLKNSGGVLQARNAADNAFADVEGANLKTAGNLTDGSNSATVAAIKGAVDAKASYDADLGCLTFNL